MNGTIEAVLHDTAPGLDDVVRLFDARVAESPERVAIASTDGSWTYAALARRVDDLCGQLIATDIKTGDLVAVALPRGVDLIAAMFAILRLGAAYLPVDLSAPADRVQWMIDDSEPAALLASGSEEMRLPQTVRVMCPLPATLARCQREATAGANLTACCASSSELTRLVAYVIYTSGSTGRPKGTTIEREALAKFTASITSVLPFVATDRQLALTNITFDIAFLELIVPLCRGACVVLARDDESRDPLRLAEFIETMSPTSVQATPSHWSMLIERHSECLRGRRLVAGGEPLYNPTALTLCAVGSDVYNVYGPTEATVWATAHQVRAAELGTEWSPVSIGRALPGYYCRVLGTDLEEVPVGADGELYIAGPMLARGYQKRAGLTASRFIASVFGQPGTRMYRTGDKARVRNDGLIEFRGRLDNQVKILGHRVELTEIEAALQSCGHIREAVVVAPDGDRGSRRIVAFVITDRDTSVAEVRRDVEGWLPKHMLPASIVRLTAMPLTSNGKVDRVKLSLLAQIPESSPDVPADDCGMICRLMSGALNGAPVDPDSDFFELGGDSLAAGRFLWEIETAFGVVIELDALLEHASPRLLTQMLQRP